ncbi:hypothetical protein BKA61DRAFT_262076 [Leptodontidium sp. MPI-SDFR-AT-0119]|nr:hypothetical protein BKA61DRAFT_262076 [Leptodontidium sp. MPI-SDFR-AT-0119]
MNDRLVLGWKISCRYVDRMGASETAETAWRASEKGSKHTCLFVCCALGFCVKAQTWTQIGGLGGFVTDGTEEDKQSKRSGPAGGHGDSLLVAGGSNQTDCQMQRLGENRCSRCTHAREARRMTISSALSTCMQLIDSSGCYHPAALDSISGAPYISPIHDSVPLLFVLICYSDWIQSCMAVFLPGDIKSTSFWPCASTRHRWLLEILRDLPV